MDETIRWLLSGDVSVQYLTHRDLLHSDAHTLAAMQRRIETEGIGARLLACRGENGHWGKWFYQPKWTSTHYTLASFADLGMPSECAPCREMVHRAYDECMLDSGGINFSKTMVQSDICIDGMVLAYASYFCPDDPRNVTLADFVLNVAKPDGGYSWDTQSRIGDPHTTICVLEGLNAYGKAGLRHRIRDIQTAQRKAIQFLFSHSLFIDEDTRYQKLTFPYRYRYDLLRFLDYCAASDMQYDARMKPAIDWLKRKQTTDGRWVLGYTHKGSVHFEMEPQREPSRFITLKALCILKQYAGPKCE